VELLGVTFGDPSCIVRKNRQTDRQTEVKPYSATNSIPKFMQKYRFSDNIHQIAFETSTKHYKTT